MLWCFQKKSTEATESIIHQPVQNLLTFSYGVKDLFDWMPTQNPEEKISKEFIVLKLPIQENLS